MLGIRFVKVEAMEAKELWVVEQKERGKGSSRGGEDISRYKILIIHGSVGKDDDSDFLSLVLSFVSLQREQ